VDQLPEVVANRLEVSVELVQQWVQESGGCVEEEPLYRIASREPPWRTKRRKRTKEEASGRESSSPLPPPPVKRRPVKHVEKKTVWSP
jgi:hypothetical protein